MLRRSAQAAFLQSPPMDSPPTLPMDSPVPSDLSPEFSRPPLANSPPSSPPRVVLFKCPRTLRVLYEGWEQLPMPELLNVADDWLGWDGNRRRWDQPRSRLVSAIEHAVDMAKEDDQTLKRQKGSSSSNEHTQQTREKGPQQHTAECRSAGNMEMKMPCYLTRQEWELIMELRASKSSGDAKVTPGSRSTATSS